ncbi:MAG: MOSC N-terminal beta barrel domain-containing protein [Gemmatimonadetes bacterium]|nr:MOSC N-terminal beta barrel domain-containing protein [Gemmatimonadota bacterium]
MSGAPAARVTRLFVYPVKSAAGIPCDEAVIDAFGIQHDRRWMAVRSDGSFLSQRTCPRLALVRVSLTANGIALSAPGVQALDIAVPPADAVPARTVRIWRDQVDAVPAGAEAAQWLTDALDIPCSLVWMPDAAVRRAPRHATQGPGRVSFADAYPFLLLSQEAVDELDRRVAQPEHANAAAADVRVSGMPARPRICVERFRPNIVIAGGGPHVEDAWRAIRIGDLRFLVAKPCARCVTTTVDPASSARGKEPLRTLATYRFREGEVWFGQNLLHERAGALRVGDAIEVLQTGESPVFERPR